jgi:hypothetical protein
MEIPGIKSDKKVFQMFFELVSKYKWCNSHRDTFIEKRTNAFNLMANNIMKIIDININFVVSEILNIFESSA